MGRSVDGWTNSEISSGSDRHADKGSHMDIQRPEKEADRSALSRVQFRNVWRLPPFPLHAYTD
jgi:hypothetical protein